MIHTTSTAETVQSLLYERIATELSIRPGQVQRTGGRLRFSQECPDCGGKVRRAGACRRPVGTLARD